MAKYYGYSTQNPNYCGLLTVNTLSQDVANNRSTIEFIYKLYRADGYASPYSRSTGNHFTMLIDGTAVTLTRMASTVTCGTSEANAVELFYGTRTINHNADGTKSITVRAQYYNDESSTIGSASSPLTASGTYTLATIPRASSFSIPSSFTLGTAGTVTITPAASTFSHVIRFSVPGATAQEVTVAAGTTSQAITFPMSFANQITAAASAQGTIRVTTKSGSTTIGYTEKAVTVKVPNNSSTKPTATVNIAARSDTPLGNHYIQGYCRAHITVTDISLKYGARIASVTVDGQVVTGVSTYVYDSETLTERKTFQVKVTDTRGFSTTYLIQPTSWYPYAQPSLSGVSVYRANSSGSKNPSGTYLAARATANISAEGVGNTYTLTIATKTATGAYGPERPLESGVRSVFSGFSIDTTYRARITLTDALGNTAKRAFDIPTSARIFNFGVDGKSWGIGKFAETPELVDSAWPIKSSGLETGDITAEDITADSVTAPNLHGTADTLAVTGGDPLYVENYHMNAGTSKTLSIPDNFRGLVIIQAPSDVAGRHWLLSVVCSSAGDVYTNTIFGSAQVTLTKATNALTVEVTSSGHYLTLIGFVH